MSLNDRVRELTERLADFLRSPRAVVLLVFTALAADYLLVTIVVPILPIYLENQGWGITAVGILFASKSFFQILFNPIAGVLTDRFGPRIPLLVSLIVLTISTLGFAFGNNYYELLFARSIQGIASAATMSGGMAYVSEVFLSDEERGGAMGMAMLGIALGVTIGPSVGGGLYDLGGGSKSLPFVVVALIIALDAVFQFFVRVDMKRIKQDAARQYLVMGSESEWESELDDSFLSEPYPSNTALQRQHHCDATSSMDGFATDYDDDGGGGNGSDMSVKDSTDSLMGQSAAVQEPFMFSKSTEVEHGASAGFKRKCGSCGIFTLLADPYVTLVAFTIIGGNACIAVIEPLLPLIVEKGPYNLGTFETGLTFLATSLSYAITSTAIGYVGHKIGRSKLVYIGLIGMGCCTAFISYPPHIWGVLVLLAGVGLFMGILDGAAMPLLAQMITQRHRSQYFGSVFALADIAFSLGFVLGPFIGTIMAEYVGIYAGFAFFGVFAIVSAPVICFGILEYDVDDFD